MSFPVHQAVEEMSEKILKKLQSKNVSGQGCEVQSIVPW
jgi:hypothetical protein